LKTFLFVHVKCLVKLLRKYIYQQFPTEPFLRYIIGIFSSLYTGLRNQYLIFQILHSYYGRS
jgi:hypothetical protein